MNYNYTFFESSISKLRKLRCWGYDLTSLLDAPGRLFPELDLGLAPRLISETGGTPVEDITETSGQPPESVVLTRSYARKPGRGVIKLEEKLRNRLPEDFRQFHELYDEVLVTTRTYPLHLWNVDRIIEEIDNWRDVDKFPLRFFRFAEYWNIYGLYYALWQATPNGTDWKVVIVDHGNRDDQLDQHVEAEYILAESYYAWLKSWIERDGLPDPYKEIGGEGGFLDPA